MKHLPSPTSAERNQRRKLQYLPSVWWFVAAIAAIVVVTIVTH
jgi:hypothetical protein